MALPFNFDPTSPAGTDAPLASQLQAIKQGVIDILGLPAATGISTALFAVGSNVDGAIATPPIFKQGTLTTSVPVLNDTVTWNAGATTFRQIVVNVTDTASAAASLFEDFQIAGASKWSLDKAGKLRVYAGAAPTNGQLLIGNTAGGTWDVATLTAGAGLTVTNAGGSVTVTLPDTGPGATGPIGSATVTPVVTIDAKGRVTALTSATIAWSGVKRGTVTITAGQSNTTTIVHGGTTTPKLVMFYAARTVDGAGFSQGHVTDTVDNTGMWMATDSTQVEIGVANRLILLSNAALTQYQGFGKLSTLDATNIAWLNITLGGGYAITVIWVAWF